MAKAPGDPASATDYSWMRKAGNLSVAVPQAIKRPLENRVWYNYYGGGATDEGTVRKESAVGRVLDDGTTQLTRSEYNTRGQITKRIDPVGRETVYEYDGIGLDLLQVKQKNGGSYDVLEMRTYNSQHLPLTVTDAAGQTTAYTYNAAGQVLTVRNAKNETTTYTYNPTGYLTTITGPVTGASTSYTYDGYGRIRTVTDADSYTLTYDYDTAGRRTRVTYPDGTHEQTTYERLDPVERRDRLGRITRMTYDARQRIVATTDPVGRTITQAWCGCGSLDALIDANGNRTRWERNVQGRVTREVRADNVTDTLYTYDLAGRLKTTTDANDQVTTHIYLGDNSLASTVWTNAQIATPSVSYTYDAIYPRVATMIDGIGTTSYTYKSSGTLGAGQVATVDGPVANDTISYTYDELGRVTTRAINGAANTMTWTFDALGRLTSEANVLGTFTYGYEAVSSRIASITYPNNQTSSYSYLPTNQDRRLQTIHHNYPNGSTLSKFDYTYDAVGNILTWRQQADAYAILWKYSYDAADQLTTAVKENTDPTPQVLKRYGYAYDPAGNRTVEQIDDAITLASHDKLNRLTTQVPGGPMMFAGTINEPATVTIQGAPAAVTTTNAFRGTASLTSGTNTVTIVAIDPAGNSTTRQWTVDVAGLAKTFTFDSNGNVLSDGSRTFEWNARNQPVAVTSGTRRTEFSYDGANTRRRIVEKDNGVVIADRNLIWSGVDLLQIQHVLPSLDSTYVFPFGTSKAGVARYVTRNHLDSVDVVTNAAAGLLHRSDYDPFGGLQGAVGPDAGDRGFTNALAEPSSGIWLMQHRGYDRSTARWLSEDPLGLHDGPNLYAYVSNNPLRWIDPTGTVKMGWPLPPNGNVWNSFDPQDGVCSVGPFSGLTGGSPCIEECCFDHDICFAQNKCNLSSWFTMLLGSKPCNMCNWVVMGCILQADTSPTGCGKCSPG